MAITAETIARPRTGVFNDAAVLLYALDAGAAVITDARVTG